MTPNEYRKKHKRCATCKYYSKKIMFTYLGRTYYYDSGVCAVKNIDTEPTSGKFCRVYKSREFKE